jgi:hypothetical protein
MTIDKSFIDKLISESVDSAFDKFLSEEGHFEPVKEPDFIFTKIQEAHDILDEINSLIEEKLGLLGASRDENFAMQKQLYQRGISDNGAIMEATAVDAAKRDAAAELDKAKSEDDLRTKMAELSGEIAKLASKVASMSSTEQTTSSVSSPGLGTLKETFSLTKERFDEIVAEEVQLAIKQGII